MTTMIARGEGENHEVVVQWGIFQGCPLSGLLFIISLDPVPWLFEEEMRYKALAYADDMLQSKQKHFKTRSRHCSKRPKKHRTIDKSAHVQNPSHKLHQTRERHNFSINGDNLPTIEEGETHGFLSVAFQAYPPATPLEEPMKDALVILVSKLAPWQKLDALNSFIYPASNFAMKNRT